MMERRLSELLRTRVDVVAELAARSRIQDEIDRDRCVAF
jgi:predicted nucleotidyltransferase